jgi:phage-related protein
MSKVLMVLRGEIKTPPLAPAARREVGLLLRSLQEGAALAMPHSRPMPIIGPRCHELRVTDAGRTWRVVYRVDPDAVLVVDVFEKKTRETPHRLIENCRERLKRYDEAAEG